MDSLKVMAARVFACLLLASTAACSVGSSTKGDGDITSDDSGKGTIQQYAPDERESVEDFSGTLLDGGTIAADDLDGDVAVVNVWGSWCGPCRIEAPALRAVATAFADQGVQFLGLNVRDNDAAARTFEKRFEIPYPSIRSQDSPSASLAFAGQLSTTAVPMTVVLDRDRRIAARVVGQVSESTLRGLVEDVLAEGGE